MWLVLMLDPIYSKYPYNLLILYHAFYLIFLYKYIFRVDFDLVKRNKIIN